MAQSAMTVIEGSILLVRALKEQQVEYEKLIDERDELLETIREKQYTIDDMQHKIDTLEAANV